MWYFVKHFSEVHNNHIGLTIVTLGHSCYPANNLVCIRRINRTTFQMSVTSCGTEALYGSFSFSFRSAKKIKIKRTKRTIKGYGSAASQLHESLIKLYFKKFSIFQLKL